MLDTPHSVDPLEPTEAPVLTERVLVVEDDPATRMGLSELIRT